MAISFFILYKYFLLHKKCFSLINYRNILFPLYKFNKQHDLMEELPVQEKKRGWGRVVLWVLLTPLLLFVLLMALLYVPPVQNIIRQKATEIAS